MATHGTVYTPHMEIEPRQHELLGVDLGEGPSRRSLILGFVALVVWAVPLFIFLGPPTKNSMTLYILPPSLIIAFGFSRSTRMRRRMRLTEWVLAVRYAITSRPIVRYGARRPHRSENLPLRQRWSFLARAANIIAPNTSTPPWANPEGGSTSVANNAPNGRPVTLRPRANVVGSEALLARLQAYTTRKGHQ